MEETLNWLWVEQQVAQTMDVWRNCAARTAGGDPQYSVKEQRKREQAYDEGLHEVEREVKRTPRSSAERMEIQRRIVAAFSRFAPVALGLEDNAVELITGSFLPAGTQLARWARRFDPELSMEDTIQACRNAWTACGLQPLLGEPMGITPSILGYSLLYPYSDNYLDREDASKASKLEFSRRFRERLRGEMVAPRNQREAAVWSLVQLIEEQYSRNVYPQVFDSLLAIHQAQEQSLAQVDHCLDDEAEVLRISCSKGGTSVMADACLAHGWLSEDESHFAFEWGVLLQLGDDLQDVREDLRRGSTTLFTRAVKMHVPLDGLVVQLLNMSDHLAARMDALPNGDAVLKGLLRLSWRSLILMAVADAKEFFSSAFLEELEPSSAFRFNFQRARRKRLVGRRGLWANVFEAFVEAGEGDNAALPLPEGRMQLCLAATCR